MSERFSVDVFNRTSKCFPHRVFWLWSNPPIVSAVFLLRGAASEPSRGGRHARLLLHRPGVRRWPQNGPGGHHHSVLHLLWGQGGSETPCAGIQLQLSRFGQRQQQQDTLFPGYFAVSEHSYLFNLIHSHQEKHKFGFAGRFSSQINLKRKKLNS